METDSDFGDAMEKYIVNVTPHLEIFLQEVYMLPEMQSLGLPLRTILFGVIGRFHHEMDKVMKVMDLHPLEAYGYAMGQVIHDPHVNALMNQMMNTGVNAAVNNLLEF